MSDVSDVNGRSAEGVTPKAPGRRAWQYFLPLVIFFALVGFFWKGLSLNPREVPSALIDKPAPNSSLPILHSPEKNFGTADMKGKVWLLNVWGSWCVSCRYEHPFLNELSKQQVLPIVGFNWKDNPETAKAWLVKYGDPYMLSVSDLTGRAAIDWGVYGAPETFVIDKTGTIPPADHS
jgi:cytochrome c biogenesis protein CcmG, thiol:disulfide interchange protein DsbE